MPQPDRIDSAEEAVVAASGTTDTAPIGAVRHVAIVIAGLGVGGAERVLSLIANDWIARGRQVTVIAFDSAAAESFHPLAPEIRCIRLDIPHSGARLGGFVVTWRRYRALRRTLAAVDADITISFLTKINALTLLASLGTARRVIVSERNNPRLQRLNVLWSHAMRLLYPRAEAIVMQTDASLECLGARARAKAFVIPNPISVAPIPGPTRVAPVLVATGRLARQKGFDLLIDAFARIADRHPRWALAIWGEGEERAALVRQIDDLGLGHRIVLRGNSRSTGEWLGQADAFVLSSRFEGFCNALGEALAAGLPAVSFACDYGPPEMIRHDVNGLLVPTGDVAALAQALDRMLGDAALRGRLGEAARAIGERFHPRTVIAQWDELMTESPRG